MELHHRYAKLKRLIINRVEGPLHRAGLPPPRPALVRQQIEADEGIRAIFGEGYQVTAGVRHHNQFVPLGAVPHSQLDLTQGVLAGGRAILQLAKPMLELHGGEGQGDVRGQARRGLLVRQVLLGARHAGAQVGDAAERAGRVRLAVPVLEGEGGRVYTWRRRGRRQRGV